MADYDSGEITDREALAAERTKEIARFNRDSINNQLQHQLEEYRQANRQNARLRDVQNAQIRRKAEADRFEAQRGLRNAAIGLFGSMNQAMNGSTVGNTMRMLEDRSDADNQTYWNQLQENQNAINNAYQESYNQNQVAKNSATTSAAKAIRDIEADQSANLNNINPNLYVRPGVDEEGILNAWSPGPYDERVPDALAKVSGYIMPRTSVQTARKLYPRNRVAGNDYYSRLINGFNGR